jgi:acetolactate synthase-1/2/3 large subunit
VLDVSMKNEPVPTSGHWNINDIYTPDGGRHVKHAALH